MKYVIAHSTGTCYLGKNGWTSKSFARRFDSFENAEEFCVACALDDQGVKIEAA
jgi:secreted Zn-dependent insulinase-like peptidase